MEQRPLRLGDIVDDYCPRERRITNHAIVAIVENSIRQTRCATCDAEHIYKEAKVPRRKKTAEDLAGGQLVAPRGEPGADAETGPVAEASESAQAPDPPVDRSEPADVPVPVAASADSSAAEAERAEPEEAAAVPEIDDGDAWPAHRTLIRATLPRVEGETPPPRPIPEFTMHQRQTRGGNQFRQGQGRQGQNGQGRNGNRQARSGQGNSNGNVNGNVAGNGNAPGNSKSSGRSGRGRSRNRGGQHKRSR